MKNRSVITLALGFLLLQTTSAHSMDLPFLTWEKGKVQEVVLGETKNSQNWKVEFVADSGQFRASFKPSISNRAGFKVYTIQIPKNLPDGRYWIQTSGERSQNSRVAQVVLVPPKVYEIVRVPWDLFLILLLLSIQIAVITLSRNRSLRFVEFEDNLTTFNGFEVESGYIPVDNFKFSSFEVRRGKLFDLLPQSFLKLLVAADSNFLFKMNRRLLSVLPYMAIGVALILSFVWQKNPQIISIQAGAVLVIAVLVGICDLLSGLLETLIFLLISICFLPNFGINTLTSLVFISGSFFVPGVINLIGSFYCKGENANFLSKFAWTLISLSYIPLMYLILQSLNYALLGNVYTNFFLVSMILIGLTLKQRHFFHFLEKNEHSRDKVVQLQVHRVVTPISAISLSLLLLSLFFNWCQNLTWSLVASIMWSLPILISVVKINLRQGKFISNLGRRNSVELSLICLTQIALYFTFQEAPWLLEDRSIGLLLATAFPVIIHAVYVMVVESNSIGREVII